MKFKNIKEAHSFYNFPGSFRLGSIYKKDYGIIRSYSNGSGKDFYKQGMFLYKIKNRDYYLKFLENKTKNNPIRLFIKTADGVSDMGLHKVVKLTNNYVYLKNKT